MSTTVQLPPVLLQLVDRSAKELKLSRNRYIIRALEQALVRETQWSDRFVEELVEARSDDEDRQCLEKLVADVAAKRTRKGPPPL